ncbi:MAG: shikimate dehydrogenase [Bacteroidota bacterium]
MRVYGLIGYPLSHSFSSAYFNNKFKVSKIHDTVYENFQLANIDSLPLLIKSNNSISGLNVTIPYKESVISYLDEIDPIVKKVGAVNTILVNNKRLIGYNTDVKGFEKSFFKESIKNRKILILGSGGASKAVQYVLSEKNIPYLVVSRNSSNDSFIEYSSVKQYINEYSIIINTTPVGSYPESESCPEIPYNLLSDKHFLFDLIYNPEKSKFLSLGENAGAKIKNGYEMLIMQAEESWKIWNKTHI